MRIMKIAILAGYLLIYMSGFCQSNFKTTMKSLLGKDFPNYQWLNVPINNYGVATCYAGTNTNTKKNSFLCGTYSFFGIKKLPQSIDSLLIPNIMIEKGCSPSINATIQVEKKSIYKAILPNIASLFGLNASLTDSLAQNAVIDELEICDRRIQEGEVNTYIEDFKTDPKEIKKNFRNQSLILVVKDIVITKLKISIKSNAQLAAELDLKLKGKLVEHVGDNAEIGMYLKKINNSTYTMEINSPMVIGFLAVKKGDATRGGNKGNDNDFKLTGWKGYAITEVQLDDTSFIAN